MSAFYHDWSVRGGNVAIDIPLQSCWCRDFAYHTLNRSLFDLFAKKTQEALGYARAPSLWQYEHHTFVKWAFEHGNNKRYTGTYADDRSDGQWIRDEMIGTYIPRIIDILRPLFPTITFTPALGLISEFEQVTVHGIHISGDTEIIPAFYWIGMLQRRACDVSPDNPAFNQDGTFRPESMDLSHQQEWKRLHDGTSRTGLFMLASMYGPISSRSVSDTYYEDCLMQIRLFMASYKGNYRKALESWQTITL